MLPLLSWTIASRCSFSYISRTGGGGRGHYKSDTCDVCSGEIQSAFNRSWHRAFQRFIWKLHCVPQLCHTTLCSWTLGKHYRVLVNIEYTNSLSYSTIIILMNWESRNYRTNWTLRWTIYTRKYRIPHKNSLKTKSFLQSVYHGSI